MNKEDILKAFPDYEECSEMYTMEHDEECLSIITSIKEPNIYLKPKQKQSETKFHVCEKCKESFPAFPIVFNNSIYTLKVFEDGYIKAEDKTSDLETCFRVGGSLELLDKAIAKSKEIRGLK